MSITIQEQIRHQSSQKMSSCQAYTFLLKRNERPFQYGIIGRGMVLLDVTESIFNLLFTSPCEPITHQSYFMPQLYLCLGIVHLLTELMYQNTIIYVFCTTLCHHTIYIFVTTRRRLWNRSVAYTTLLLLTDY